MSELQRTQEKVSYLHKKLGFKMAQSATHTVLLNLSKAPNEATIRKAPDYWTGYFTALREAGELIAKQELAE